MNKLEHLKEWFKDKKGVLVAFSGGVDSALLLAVAHEILGDKVLAVTASSPLNTFEETECAIQLAKNLGINHKVVEMNDLENSLVRDNPPDRCYYCKKARFEKMLFLAKEYGLEVVVEGSNLDDLNDYRPGLKAVQELGIASPLVEIGLRKREIRELARNLNLSVWDKPSEPCLATRIPTGAKLSLEILKRVSKAERVLKAELLIKQVRVRDHNHLARIEVEEKELEKVLKKREKVIEVLNGLGYRFVTLDLMGYRTGSMN